MSAELDEFLGSLTASEEQAIADVFGSPIEDLPTAYAQLRAAQFREAP